MGLPKPETGLVIRYSYLWESEVRRGREEGVKDRPCAVVLASQTAPDGKIKVTVAPITHTPPERGTTAIEVPPKVGQHLGLDAAKSWIVTSEVNRFTWPGPDVRPANKKGYAFGHLPNRLAASVRDGVFECARDQLKTVERDEPKPEQEWRRGAASTPSAPTPRTWTERQSNVRHEAPPPASSDDDEQDR